jgi:hypothetical protein
MEFKNYSVQNYTRFCMGVKFESHGKKTALVKVVCI